MIVSHYSRKRATSAEVFEAFHRLLASCYVIQGFTVAIAVLLHSWIALMYCATEVVVGANFHSSGCRVVGSTAVWKERQRQCDAFSRGGMPVVSRHGPSSL